MRFIVSFLFWVKFVQGMKNTVIIEDDAVFAGILKNFLVKRGYPSRTVSHLKSAKAELLSDPPDLILLDLNLPDGNGLDLLDYIRKQDIRVGKIIIMTSFNDVRTAVKALKNGAHDYIIKPVNPEELMMIIGETNDPDFQDQKIAPADNDGMITGISEPAREMMNHIHLVSPTQ